MLTTQQNVAARIKALLAKTTENGCTEAEAMLAAEKARELMDRYNIDRGEIGMEEEGAYRATCSLNIAASRWKALELRRRLSYHIGQFCDCKVWYSGQTLTYFGLRSDADFAVWLTENLDQFVRTAVIEYMAKQPRAARNSKRGAADLFDSLADVPPLDARGLWEREKAFVLGACERINIRLRDMASDRRSGGDGKSLVVIKWTIVNREFDKLGMRLGRGTALTNTSRDGGARQAGYAAGERASFGRPINGGRSLPALGYRG